MDRRRFMRMPVVAGPAGFGTRASAPPRSHTDSDFHVSIEATAAFRLDPAQSTEMYGEKELVMRTVFERLIQRDLITGRIGSRLLESATSTNGGRVWLLNLKRHIHFHHTPWFTPTRPFNAHDVVFSLADQFADGRRAPPYGLRLIEGVEAVSDHLIRLELRQPMRSLTTLLGAPYLSIKSAEYAAGLDPDKEAAIANIAPIGTGPYQLAISRPTLVGERSTLPVCEFIPNPRFQQNPARNGIQFHDDGHRGPEWQWAALRTGSRDVVGILPKPLWEDGNGVLQLHNRVGERHYFLTLDCNHGPFKDPAIRRAFKASLDMVKLRDSLGITRGARQLFIPDASQDDNADSIGPDSVRDVLDRAGIQRPVKVLLRLASRLFQREQWIRPSVADALQGDSFEFLPPSDALEAPPDCGCCSMLGVINNTGEPLGTLDSLATLNRLRPDLLNFGERSRQFETDLANIHGEAGDAVSRGRRAYMLLTQGTILIPLGLHPLITGLRGDLRGLETPIGADSCLPFEAMRWESTA